MIETSPPQLCTILAESSNLSNVLMEECDSLAFSNIVPLPVRTTVLS